MAKSVKKKVEATQEGSGNVLVRNVPADILSKLQAISSIESTPFNQVYNLAFVKLVEAYENKNGKIKIRTKGQGLQGI